MTRLVKSRFTLKKDCGPAFIAGAKDLVLTEIAKKNKAEEDKKESIEDVIDKKVGSASRMSERQAQLTSRKEAERERLLEEQQRKDEEAEQEARRKEDEERGFGLDYDEDMSKKEIRQESRENKRQIRDWKRKQKQALKEEGLKGKEKRKAKKEIRQGKKERKILNKCAKFEAQGKTSKRWYTKNC